MSPTASYAALRTAAAQTPEVARALTATLVGAGRADGVDSVAAGRQARLVELFTEHVHLTALAVATALRAGNTDDRARAALDDNSVALGEAFGGPSPPDDRQAFLTRWRQWVKDLHIHATEYDPDVRAEAARRLGSHADAAGRSLSRLSNGDVTPAAATAALRALHRNQLANVTALRNHDDSAFRKLGSTAREFAALAAAPAGGVPSAAAALRAELTGLLATQVFQTRLAQYVAVTNEGGVTGPVHLAATRAIGDTTTRLGELIAREAPHARHPFDRAWSELAGHLQDYVAAVRTGDRAAGDRALAALRADPRAITRVLAGAAALERVLDEHVAMLSAAMAAPVA
jgi:hypothetical protein